MLIAGERTWQFNFRAEEAEHARESRLHFRDPMPDQDNPMKYWISKV